MSLQPSASRAGAATLLGFFVGGVPASLLAGRDLRFGLARGLSTEGALSGRGIVMPVPELGASARRAEFTDGTLD